jgi:hypothetical protein
MHEAPRVRTAGAARTAVEPLRLLPFRVARAVVGQCETCQWLFAVCSVNESP